MTGHRDGRFVGSGVLMLAFVSCTEARIGLLEPIGTSGEEHRLVEGGDGSGVRGGGLEDAACALWNVEREPEAALMMWIVDVSGTMSLPLSGSTTSKWDVERPVLSQIFDSLPARLGLGVLYFPNMATQPSTTSRPASACVNLGAMIPVGMLAEGGSRQRATLEGSIARNAVSVQAGEPTVDAYLAGLEELGRTSLDGMLSVLLLTDGAPTFSEGCVGSGSVDSPVDPSPLVQAIAEARRAGVRTFVVGAPGSEHTNSRGDDARPWLSRAAEAGGTAFRGCSDSGPNYCHYDISTERDFGRSLAGALADITRRVARCDIALPDPPQNQVLDPARVNVVYTGADGTTIVLPRDDSQSCSVGWHYSGDRQSIVLCNQACGLVSADLGTKVELVFGCATAVP